MLNKKRSGKNIYRARSVFPSNKFSTFIDAINALRSVAYAKFDETVDVAVNLNIDVKRSDQAVRGVVILPAGTGKKVRIAVICKDELINSAISYGADIAGLAILDKVSNGIIEFDVCITTPDMMQYVSRVARILGPKGLMPNPKFGTVSTDIERAVQNVKAGQVEFRADKSGIVHGPIGKFSFSNEDLNRNFLQFMSALFNARPSVVKPSIYFKTIAISSTMGPAAKFDSQFLVNVR